VRVLDIEHEADVGETLGAAAMIDRVQHEHIQRREVGNACGGRAAHHPAVEGMAEQDQAELQLRERRHGARREMRRGDDGSELAGCGDGLDLGLPLARHGAAMSLVGRDGGSLGHYR
jgi:hypothetical protein